MKLAVIGLGSIGRRHLGNFHTVGVDSLTAWDVVPEQRAAAASQFPFAKVTDTLEAALDGADGVAVCTPPDSHLALGRLALERAAHVMVEKPLTQTAEGVAEWLGLAAVAFGSLHILLEFSIGLFPTQGPVSPMVAASFVLTSLILHGRDYVRTGSGEILSVRGAGVGLSRTGHTPRPKMRAPRWRRNGMRCWRR